jgi:hypothetical protein
MRLTVFTQNPRSIRPPAVVVCDRCGEVNVDSPCRCRTPYDQAEVDRRHRDAVARAQVQRHRSAVAARSKQGGVRSSDRAFTRTVVEIQ